jgi:hypothetical protein
MNATLTITEQIDAQGVAHWAARNGRTLVTRVDCAEAMGMWDTGVLQDAIATALHIPQDDVRPVRGKRPAGFGHYVAPRFYTVPA